MGKSIVTIHGRSWTAFLLCMAILAPVLNAGEGRPALDKKNMDLKVRPGDDFFRYANGAWIRDLAMPADKSEYDAFDQVREQNRARLRDLFEGLAAVAATAAKGTAAQKIGDFYATAMDATRVESLGSTPLNDDLARIARAATGPEIQDLLAGFHRENSSVLFGASVEVDLMNSKVYGYYLVQ
ncbi:MAG TPA: M13 family metallopeptidase N-terminal domain-containing protein, partial [Candidatus Binatia bacterium]|nr:M13 family metallopeptidase N-terminal domain-containing protein [Candidatus Binatia bacterium]